MKTLKETFQEALIIIDDDPTPFQADYLLKIVRNWLEQKRQAQYTLPMSTKEYRQFRITMLDELLEELNQA